MRTLPMMRSCLLRLACLFLVAGCATGSRVEKLSATDTNIWLEDISSERSMAWVKEQNAKTRKRLESRPVYVALRRELKEVLESSDRLPLVFEQQEGLFNFWQDKVHVAGILRRTTKTSYESGQPVWETIFDLDKWNAADKKKWVWKGIECLPGSSRCLLRLSLGGGDAVLTKEFDLQQKSFIDNGFIVPMGKTSASWWDLNTLIVGTDFGPGTLTDSGYPRMLKSLKRGQMLEEAKTLIEGQKQDVAVSSAVFDHSEERFLVLTRDVSFYQSQKFMIAEDGLPTEISVPMDSEIKGFFKNQILLVLKSDGSVGGRQFKAGSLISIQKDQLPAIQPALVFEPTEIQVLEGVAISKDAVLLEILDNVESRMMSADWTNQKWDTKPLKLPERGILNVVTADAQSSTVYLTFEGPLTPTSLFRLGPKGETLIRRLQPLFATTNHIVERRHAASADGTKIPYTVVRPKDQKGPLPTLMYGYGGFEVAILPGYNPVVGKAWLEKGNVYVIAHIRGGGEFGPRWHKSALKAKRSKAFEDFEAVAMALAQEKTTTPRQLAIRGGSNGGLLMGATLLRRPDLYRAVICEVPLLDMVRFHKLLAGASWMEEYGNPETSDLDSLLKISPYHLIGEGPYPEAFVSTSTKDDRVHPGHARKFVAKMQQAQHPILYFENIEGGHNRAADLPQLADLHALQYSYLNEKLSAR